MDTPDKSTQTRGFHAWVPLLIALATGLGMVVGMRMGKIRVVQLNGEPGSSKVEIGRIEEVLRFIESHYVDSVDTEALKKSAIDAMLGSLDPHSRYLSPEALVSVNRDLYNEYIGLGFLTRTIEDSVYVMYVFKDSPAYKAGLRVGDHIVSINDQAVDAVHGNFETGSDEMSLGDTVYMNYVREDKAFRVPLPNARIPISELPAYFMLNDSISYIKIDRFGKDIYRVFMEALESLSKHGAKDLIIDLRGNSGGFLNETVKIISQLFYLKDLPITWAEGTHTPKKIFRTKGHPFFDVDDIAVLVDEETASASEILAGALQDLSRGVIVGRRSFGKGLVQEQFELPDGYALRITTARYYLPSGRSIQRDYGEGNEAYREHWTERLYSGELLSKDSIRVPDTTRYFTRRGRIVYDRSGIIPDIFVPYRSFELKQEWGNITTAVDNYIILHYPSLKKHYQFRIIADSVEIVRGGNADSLFAVRDPDSLCSEVTDMMLQKNPAWDRLFHTVDSLTIRKELCHYILSTMLYSEGDKNVYYKYEMANDPVALKAFEILRSNKTDSILQAQME